MGRPLRLQQAGYAYHVLNRGNGRVRLFETSADYASFERILESACQRTRMRLCAYCVMPNHWHLVVWPREDGDLARFVGWLSLTHTQRWHAFRHSAGSGHVYQGRYKSFVIQRDAHFLHVCRYVERNALRAGLVDRAEAWRFSSLWRRHSGDAESRRCLSGWPVARPDHWLRLANSNQPAAQVEQIQMSIQRERPLGDDTWIKRTARRLGLETTLRPRGRPKNQKLTTKKAS